MFKPEEPKYLTLHDKKISFCHIYKSGCESLRFLCLYENNLVKYHRQKSWSYGLWIQSDKLITDSVPDDYKWIAIVRHPLKRIVSVYVNMIIKNRSSRHCNALCGYLKTNAKKGFSFKDFVDFIISQPRNILDRHFKLQIDLMTNDKDKIKDIQIFKLEEMNKIREFLIKNKFKMNNLPHIGSNHNSKSDFDRKCVQKVWHEDVYDKDFEYFDRFKDTIPSYVHFFNDDINQKLYTYYKEDFDYLGYKL